VQSDTAFSLVGRAVPKGDEATCICVLKNSAFIGSRSGTLYSLDLQSGSRIEFSKSAQHSSSVVSICVTKHGLLSVDADSNLVLWSLQGSCSASMSLDVVLDGKSFLVPCGDSGVVVVGSKLMFVGVQNDTLSAALPYQGSVGVQRVGKVTFSGSHLLCASGRILSCIPMPAEGSTEWVASGEDIVLETNVEAFSAFEAGSQCVKALIGLQGGRMQMCAFDFGAGVWNASPSTSAPGSILALFYASAAAIAVFGTLLAPTLSALALDSQRSSSAVRSAPRQSKRPRDEASSGFVSVSSALPTPKQSRDVGSSDSVSLAQRLASMAGAAAAQQDEPGHQAGSDFQGELGTSSVAVPLSQALNSGNDGLLERCLSGATSASTISSTIKALSGADALLLLNQLMAKFEKRPSRGAALLVWLKGILQVHAGTLMSVPSLSDKLLPLYQGVNQRMATFKKLLRLQGRLDLLLAHV